MACGTRRPQAELVRVRVQDGVLVTGRGPGRGAYVCPDPACVERALGRGLLTRRLRQPGASDEVLRRSLEAVALGGRQTTGC